MADITFLQENPTAHQFLQTADYSDDPDYTRTSVSQYVDSSNTTLEDPVGYSITVPTGATKIKINNDWIDDVSGNAYTIYNLIPNIENTYSFLDANDSVISSGTIEATGDLRMIYQEGVHNMRDMGGWNCSTGKIKYGLLYRAGQLQHNTGSMLVGKDKWRLLNQCGIRYEFDFRDTSEVDGGTPSDTSDDYTSSILGDTVAYRNLHMDYYANAMNLSGSTYTTTVAVVKQLMENVKNGIPTIYHCAAGADRTGTIGFIIGALLGMSQSDLDKDYELTAFYPSSGYADRTRLNSQYRGMINYLKTFDGNTYEQKMIAWALDAGITITEINAFRRAMIDGSSGSIENSYDITQLLNKVVSTNTATYVEKNGAFATELLPISSNYLISDVTVQMNGEDVTEQVFTGEENVEGKVLITEQYLQDIADAIRIKLEVTTKYYPSEMAAAILQITGNTEPHTVTTQFTGNIVISNTSTTVEHGAAFNATLTASTGIESVTLLMGGEDVSSYYSSGRIAIPVVTGDIVIIAKAVSQESLVNLLPTAVDSNGDAYNGGTGYKEGYRLNSSGAESAQSGAFVTGFIPVQKGDTLTFFNIDLAGANSITNYSYCYISLYDSTKTLIKSNYSKDYVNISSNDATVNDNNMITELTFNQAVGSNIDITGLAYIRFSALNISNSSEVHKLD